MSYAFLFKYIIIGDTGASLSVYEGVEEKSSLSSRLRGFLLAGAFL